jgi:hypothetical protein
MGIPWHSIGDLTVDRDGILWARYRRGWLFLGPIEDADVEPQWASAHAELLDLWSDRFNARDEERAAYRLVTQHL